MPLPLLVLALSAFAIGTTEFVIMGLLPEAVAVVCAPRFSPNVGVFRLTQPLGLQYVLRCASPEPFHAHVDGIGGLPLYTDALPGHVAIAMAPLCVHDLRV